MADVKPARLRLSQFVLTLLLAIGGFAAVSLQIDVGGDYPDAWEGPGLTFDEPFNVAQGCYLAAGAKEFGFGLLHPRNAAQVFDGPGHFPDHPPLGRWWIGIAHELVRGWFPISEDRLVSVSAARVASASAFAVLLFCVTVFASNWLGTLPGFLAGLSLLCMPRVFAHAHLASLETFTNLFWTLAVCGVAQWWVPPRRIPFGKLALAGVLFGLLLLTKMQAVFLPVPVGLWCLFHFRFGAIRAGFVWGMVGLLVFVVGWPYMWFDPFVRLMEYFARSTDRTPLHTFYLGVRAVDKDVVWHYPFVMFGATMPAGLLLAGLFGMWTGRRDKRLQLVTLSAVFPLIAFAIPGIAVYDGIRLFLIACPMWAILCGAGAKALLEWVADSSWVSTNSSRASRSKSRKLVPIATVVFFAAQGWGVVQSAPFWLSYYSAVCGGVSGAHRLGLEPTYWGDCLTRSLWENVPRRSVVYVAPVLHPNQLRSIEEQCPQVREREIQLRVFHYDLNRENGLLLLLHRRADLPPWLQQTLPDEYNLHTVKYADVTLARFIRANAP